MLWFNPVKGQHGIPAALEKVYPPDHIHCRMARQKEAHPFSFLVVTLCIR